MIINHSSRIKLLFKVFLSWYLASLLTIYFKYLLVSRFSRTILATSGDSKSQNFFSLASFFYSDLIFHFIFIPTLLLLIFKSRLSKIHRISGYLGFLLVLVLYPLVRSILSLGNYITLDAVFEAYELTKLQPGSAKKFIESNISLKIIACISIIFCSIHVPIKRNNQLFEVKKLVIFSFLTAILLVQTCNGFTTLHQPFCYTIFNQLLRTESMSIAPIRSEKVLIRSYRNLSNMRSVNINDSSPYFGKAKNYNVIMFFLETTPAETLFLEDPLFENTFPNIHSLLNNSFYLTDAYTTYPSTRQAMFSAATGLYPISKNWPYFKERFNAKSSRGFFNNLKSNNYDLNFIAPFDPSAINEKELWESIGMKNFYYPIDSEIDKSHLSKLPCEKRYADEIFLKNKLLEQINTSVHTQKKFATIFLNSLTHVPFCGRNSFSGKSSLETHREGLIAYDAIIGEVVNSLKQNKIFDETIIVILGDHGFRIKDEYEQISPGLMNKITFKVPILIHAPGVLNQRREIAQQISVIDIIPSLEKLFGMENQTFYHGIPIWQEVRNRRLFIFGSDYFGMDGYIENGNIEMVNWPFDIQVNYPNVNQVALNLKDVRVGLDVKYNINFIQDLVKKSWNLNGFAIRDESSLASLKTYEYTAHNLIFR